MKYIVVTDPRYLVLLTEYEQMQAADMLFFFIFILNLPVTLNIANLRKTLKYINRIHINIKYMYVGNFLLEGVLRKYQRGII